LGDQLGVRSYGRWFRRVALGATLAFVPAWGASVWWVFGVGNLRTWLAIGGGRVTVVVGDPSFPAGGEVGR